MVAGGLNDGVVRREGGESRPGGGAEVIDGRDVVVLVQP